MEYKTSNVKVEIETWGMQIEAEKEREGPEMKWGLGQVESMQSG